MAETGLTSAGGWRGVIIDMLEIGYDPTNIAANFFHGSLYFIPVFIVCNLAGGFWESVFSMVRRHEINEGFLVTGMLFPLTLPPTIPLWQVAIGISFGVVIGKEIGRVLDDRAIFAERQDGRVMLRHGFTFEAGERVLAVEDVVTTGDSTREAIDVTRAAGALVAGEAAIHRSQRRPPLDGARSGLEHLKGPAAARHAVSRACRSVTSHV